MCMSWLMLILIVLMQGSTMKSMWNMHKALLQLHCRQYHSEKYTGNEIICLRPYTNATEIRRYIHLLTWV